MLLRDIDWTIFDISGSYMLLLLLLLLWGLSLLRQEGRFHQQQHDMKR
jgi:hypothetical protein